MSCQQASRVQEDPYAFTEPAPLPANTSLYKHSHVVSSSPSAANAPATSPATSVIQAGTSLLTSNNNISSGNHNVVQHRTSGPNTKVTPIKVSIVQSTAASTVASLAKSRLNGSTTATMPTSSGGTVFPDGINSTIDNDRAEKSTSVRQCIATVTFKSDVNDNRH